ncbi:MAG: transporter substrate-binding domain-containing protein, partial [Desulfosarcina sp.]
MDVDVGLEEWDAVMDAFSRGSVDIVTGMVRSAERERQFDFSITHAGIFYCLFVPKGSAIQTIDDARGKSIIVHARAYAHDWLVARQITDRIAAVSSPQKALQLLADGRYDCAIVERLSALNWLQALKIDTIAMAGPPLLCAPYAFAVKKGDDRLLARVNEGIHLMHQNGVYDALYRKWFSVTDAHARRLNMIRMGALILAVVVGLVVSVFIWNLALKRMVQRRTTALRQSQRRFEELCDLLPQTVFETDAAGRIIFLNRSGHDMLGLSEERIRGGVVLSDFLPGELNLNAGMPAADPRGKVCRVSGPGSDSFPALFYATPTTPHDGRPGLRGLLVDISFQKELERQVIESQKLEALGRLAGGVAHDFNNIITGISAYAQLIGKQPRPAETVADHADRILIGCDRAKDLVRHFLITAGRRIPQKQEVRLGRVVTEVFSLLQPTFGLNIRFNNTVDGRNDAVWAEPALVFQVLMNLCVNGAQAMSDSGGLLTIGLFDEAESEPDASSGPPRRTLFITDTGPGIDPELQERIFEPFFSTRGKENGAGIGLYVVVQALSDMGGSIRVQSETGKGTTFIVSLPVLPPPAEGVHSDGPV